MQINLFPEGTMHTASRGRAVAAADLLSAADARARRTICDITEPPMVRKRYEHAGILNRLHHARREDGPRGITSFLRDLADLAGCGVPEQDVRALAAQVTEFIDGLYQVEPGELQVLDIEEQQLEGAENAVTVRRLHLGASAEDLELGAELDRRHAAVKIARARRLTHEAGCRRFATAQGARA